MVICQGSPRNLLQLVLEAEPEKGILVQVLEGLVEEGLCEEPGESGMVSAGDWTPPDLTGELWGTVSSCRTRGTCGGGHPSGPWVSQLLTGLSGRSGLSWFLFGR